MSFKKYGEFYAIIKKVGLEKEEVVREFTNGKTSSLSALSTFQYGELMRRLRQHNQLPPGNAQRQKLFKIAKQMGWGETSDQITAALNSWLLKQKFKRPLMKLNVAELNTMLTVMEQKVLPEYLIALNK